MTFPLLSRMAAAVLAVAGVTACSSDGSNPVRDIAAAAGAGPQLAPTPDFVEQTRPASLDYVPIRADEQSSPATPARTPEEVKAAEAELEALRARNEAAGAAVSRMGGTPAPEPVPLPVKKPNSPKSR